MRRSRMWVTAVFGTAALSALMAYKTFPGTPRWPLKGGVHYTLNLQPNSFQPNSPWDLEARWALQDWASIPATSLNVRVARNSNARYTNHADGINTWETTAQPNVSWYALSFVRYTGSTMTDVDVCLNVAPKFQWVTGEYDPTKERLRIDSPLSVRGVARSMIGRSLGLDYENNFLTTTNSWYTHGSGVQHAPGYVAMLPHANDRAGARFLYPKANEFETNLMVTGWREPKLGSGAARRIWHTGSYAAGASLPFTYYVENPGNVQMPASVRAGYYLSKDAKISTSDVLVGLNYWLPGVGKHEQWFMQSKAQLPARLASGDYYLGVIIDDKGSVKESYEDDNVALVGKIHITVPDLVMEALSVDDATPLRGGWVKASFAIRNVGQEPTPTSEVWLFLGIQNEMKYHPTRTWLRGKHGIPTLAAQGRYTSSLVFQVPPEICAEREYRLHIVVDPQDKVGEEREDNNLLRLGIRPRWSPTGGYSNGAMAPAVSATDPQSLFPLCSARTGSLPSGTLYLFLMTCSGTSPGIVVPGLGTLPLNWDVCSEIGFGLHGTLFQNLVGVQGRAPEGNAGRVLGGPWLQPLLGRVAHFASIYFVPQTGLVGITKNAVPMQVR